MSGLVHAVPVATLKFGTHTTDIPEHACAPVWHPFDVVQAVAGMLSTIPSQLSSIPLHTSAVGTPAVTEQVVLVPLQIRVPERAHAPTPTVHAVPVTLHVPAQLV